MKHLAILRGINVGGKRKVLMADLKTLFSALGFTDVVTYIQSGNVMFHSNKKLDVLALETELETAIKGKFGFEVPLIVRTQNELENTFQNNPYKTDYPTENLHVTFLKNTAHSDSVIDKNKYLPDTFTLKDKVIYLNCFGKYHQTKLSNQFFEKKLNTTATTRNWKTVTKLVELMSQ